MTELINHIKSLPGIKLISSDEKCAIVLFEPIADHDSRKESLNIVHNNTELFVVYTYYPGVEATNELPGSKAEVEIINIFHFDHDVTSVYEGCELIEEIENEILKTK